MLQLAIKFWIRSSIITLTWISLSGLPLSAQPKESHVRPRIKRIVNKLDKQDVVHFGYPVGYGGKPETNNKYYKKFKKLSRIATNKELDAQSKSKSPKIVVYSFAILYSRNYEELRRIFVEHFSDTSFYWTAGGCTGVLDRVNWYMLRKLKPTKGGSGKNFLTKEEFENYCNELRRTDPLFNM